MSKARSLPTATFLVALAACGAACRSNLLVGSESAESADAASPGPAPDLTRGLVGYWKLDDGVGLSTPPPEAQDSSGLGNNGSCEDFSLSDWRPAYRDGGLLFGPAGWVRLDPSPSLNAITTAVSIGLWINLADNRPDEQIVLGRQKGTGAEVNFALHLRARRPGFGGAALAPCDSSTPLPLGRWVALAATYDRGLVRVFVDGAEAVACTGIDVALTDTSPITIGAVATTAGKFNTVKVLGEALVDEVVLYDRALTTAEVGALAAGQSPPR